MKNKNTITIENCSQLLYNNFKQQNASKHTICDGRPEIQKQTIIVGCLGFWILSSKTPNNVRFAMETPNTETAYNCRQIPYFNFKW